LSETAVGQVQLSELRRQIADQDTRFSCAEIFLAEIGSRATREKSQTSALDETLFFSHVTLLIYFTFPCLPACSAEWIFRPERCWANPRVCRDSESDNG